MLGTKFQCLGTKAPRHYFVPSTSADLKPWSQHQFSHKTPSEWTVSTDSRAHIIWKLNWIIANRTCYIALFNLETVDANRRMSTWTEGDLFPIFCVFFKTKRTYTIWIGRIFHLTIIFINDSVIFGNLLLQIFYMLLIFIIILCWFRIVRFGP